MRKIIVLFLLLVLISVGFAVQEKDNVDSQIYKELENNEKVNVIVVMKEQPPVLRGARMVSSDVKASVVSSLSEDEFEKKHDFSIVNGFSGEISEEGLEELKDNPNVEKIYYNYPVKAFLQDSVPLINASVVHNLQINEINMTGTDETVCIIDTGVDFTHLDLIGKNKICVIDCYSEGCVENCSIGDDNGHGTHVAGIVGASGGINGVAVNVGLIGVKSLGFDGSGDPYDVGAGIQWCVNNAENYNISVISMSLGGSILYDSYCNGDYLTSFIDSAVAKNITVVVASGNDYNITHISSPACIENATSVGATDKNDDIADYSNRALILDLLAPGTDINSTNITGIYDKKSGTSMATPHVAGAIALLQQYVRNELGYVLMPNEIENVLNNTGLSNDNTEGFTRIDVYEAIKSLDTMAPRVAMSLTSNPLEYNQQNLTININYIDAFLDSYNANITYPDGSLLSEFITDLDLTIENLTDLGTYTITSWANDINGNEDTIIGTFIVQDTTGLSPDSFIFYNVNTNGDNFTGNNLAFFNISVGSKYNLTNLTLYHNFTDWHANETFYLDMNETNIEFNATFPEGIYTWGIKACDINNYCTYSYNRTLFVDQSYPIVNLYGPENDRTVTNFPVDFTFNVTDYWIDNCILIINNVVNETLDSGISLIGNTKFSNIYLANGNYNWSVNCTDNVGNVNKSDEWELTMSCTPSCPDEDDVCSGTTDTRDNGCGYNCNVAGTKDCSDSNTGSDTGTSGTKGSSGLGSGESNGQSVGSTFSFTANAGYTKRFSFSDDIGLTNMDIKLKNAVAGATLSVSKTDTKPSEVSEPKGSVYTYIIIEKFDITDEDIEEVTLKFKIEKSWLNEHKGEVVLNRYNNGWKGLVTVRGDEGDDYVIYEAISPGFSVFAVTVDDNVGKTITSSNESKGLGPLTGFWVKNLPENWVNWINDNVDLSFVKNNKYYLIGGCVFVCLLVVSIVYRKKIFSKAGKEEKEFGDHKDKDKLSKKEERKKTKQDKLEEKRRKKAERLRKQLEKLEGKDEEGFFSRIKSKFRKEKGDVEEEEPEVGREKEPETKERGVFALMGKKLRGDVDEEDVKKVLEKSPKSKKEKPVKEEIKEEKKGFFSGMKHRMHERKQRKEEFLKSFEFKDIKK